MSNQQPELRPSPYQGDPNVDVDPSEQPGSYPFASYPAYPASELELDAAEDAADGDN